MDSVTKYIRKAYFVDLEKLDILSKDFPEIDKIIKENNQNFAQICAIIGNNDIFSPNMKKNVILILLQFTNLYTEIMAQKYLLQEQTKIMNDLLTKINSKDEKINFLFQQLNELYKNFY